MLREHFPLNGRRPDTLDHTWMVLTYELGSIAHGLIYMINSKTKAEGSDKYMAAYEKEAKLGMADAVTQMRILAEQMHWDWNELIDDGEERFKERMDEMEKRVI